MFRGAPLHICSLAAVDSALKLCPTTPTPTVYAGVDIGVCTSSVSSPYSGYYSSSGWYFLRAVNGTVWKLHCPGFVALKHSSWSCGLSQGPHLIPTFAQTPPCARTYVEMLPHWREILHLMLCLHRLHVPQWGCIRQYWSDLSRGGRGDRHCGCY